MRIWLGLRFQASKYMFSVLESMLTLIKGQYFLLPLNPNVFPVCIQSVFLL